ncbi:MAG: CDP-archaeol synthase [Alistipes sp.]|nr:CDP-archaeol synthase [Candidatus Alistipes equi]
MSEKLKNILIRTLSGAILVAFVIGMLCVSKWTAAALFLIILLGGLFEYFRLVNILGYHPQKVVGTVLAVAVYGISFVVFYKMGTPVQLFDGALWSVMILFVILCIPCVYVLELFRRMDHPMENIALTFSPVFYIALPLSLLLFIPYLMVSQWSWIALLAFISLVWVNDVFAFLTGLTIGRHKMSERISPKKTWEGFIGGVTATVLVSVLYASLLDKSVAIFIGLGVVTAIGAVLGDLVESHMKRSAAVKDSGSVIPGHGGFLDRFDALLVASPFAFIYLVLVTNL